MRGRGAIVGGLALLLAGLAADPLAARDALGMFEQWGAFRDPGVPRCYAIATAQNAVGSSAGTRRDHAPYASIGTWPRRQLRSQLHLRLSRNRAPDTRVNLAVGNQRFVLTGGAADAWAQDQRMDAAVIAALRSAATMSVSATDTAGRRFTDRYSLAGVATAMDAATLGCAKLR
jgi:hypothetical protein